MADITQLDPHKRLMMELLTEFMNELDDYDGLMLVGLGKEHTPSIRIIGDTKQLAEAATFVNYQVYGCISDGIED
jgi:hypothetical protein